MIRTLGKAGEKYQALLDSVAGLIPSPKEVIVVLPEGYPLPAQQLGWETFYFSPKGMVAQRLWGIERCKTRYALVCDDDVSFGPEFVRLLSEPLLAGKASFSSAPLYSFLPRPGLNACISALMAGAAPTVFYKERYNSVLRSSGYSYNRKLDKRRKYYETQSLPWTCFFAEVEAFRKLHLEEEIWLDRHGYAAMDDQTMFYKAWLLGYKTAVIPAAQYIHQDAGTAVKSNRPEAAYASTFNRVVFWHRFLYRKQPHMPAKIYTRICFGYYMLALFAFDFLSVLRKRLEKQDAALRKKGYKDGWKYVKTQEYSALPPIP